MRRRELHGGRDVTRVGCTHHHVRAVPQGALVADDLLAESVVIREEHRPGQLRVPARDPRATCSGGHVGIPSRRTVGTSIPRADNCSNGFMNSRWSLIFPSSNSNAWMKWFL